MDEYNFYEKLLLFEFSNSVTEEDLSSVVYLLMASGKYANKHSYDYDIKFDE